MYLCIVPLYLGTQNVGDTIIKAHEEWRMKFWQGGGISAAFAVQISRSAANSKLMVGISFSPLHASYPLLGFLKSTEVGGRERAKERELE